MSFLRPRYLVGLLVLVVLGACAAGYRGDIPLSSLKQRMATAHSHYVEVQETRLHYIDRGEGPVLLLLHGSGADVSAWRDVAAELAETYRVLAFDMPGTGLSEVAADGEYRIGDRVAYLTGFLDALDVQPAALVGHSVGGQVAWTAALTRPQRVQRLILLAPTGYPHPSPLTWRLAQVPLLGELLQKFTPRFVVRMNLEDAFHEDTQVTEALVDRYYDMIRREGVRGAMLKKMRAVTFARHEQVHCITRPTLVLWGSRDSWLPPRIGDWFREQIAGSKLIRLPETGHDIPEEADPQRLARLMTDWLQSTPSAGPTPEKGGDDECPDAALRGQAGLRDRLLRRERSLG